MQDEEFEKEEIDKDSEDQEDLSEDDAQEDLSEDQNPEEGDEEGEDMDQEILADFEELEKDIEPLDEQSEDEFTEPSEDESEEDFDEGTEEDGEDDSEAETELEEAESADEERESTEDEQISEEVDKHSHMKNVVEGALFVAGRPVSLEELNAKTEIFKRDLEGLLDELAMDYLMRPTALEIIRIQDKYSLQIKPEYTPKVKKFASGGLIPDAILKTLTIVALKQPLMKSMLVKIRGSTAYDHVKFLIDRGYVEARKKGRSSELLTTDQFADTFGLSRDIETLKKQMITQLGLQDN